MYCYQGATFLSKWTCVASRLIIATQMVTTNFPRRSLTLWVSWISITHFCQLLINSHWKLKTAKLSPIKKPQSDPSVPRQCSKDPSQLQLNKFTFKCFTFRIISRLKFRSNCINNQHLTSFSFAYRKSIHATKCNACRRSSTATHNPTNFLFLRATIKQMESKLSSVAREFLIMQIND